MNINSIQTSTEVIEEEFNITADNVNVVVAMCRLVAYYHLVEAVDNGSNIYYYVKQNALDALAYWVSLLNTSVHVQVFTVTSILIYTQLYIKVYIKAVL